MEPVDTRIPTVRPRGLERSVRPPQRGTERSNRSRPGNAHPVRLVRQSSQPAIVLRRRPVRPFVGARELLAILTLVIACLVTLRIGDAIGSAIDDVMNRGAVVTFDVGPGAGP